MPFLKAACLGSYTFSLTRCVPWESQLTYGVDINNILLKSCEIELK